MRGYPGRLVRHSVAVVEELQQIATFLMENLYRSSRVDGEMRAAKNVVTELVAAYRRDPGKLPERHRARIDEVGEAAVIADYVAGMTDRYALRVHSRLAG